MWYSALPQTQKNGTFFLKKKFLSKIKDRIESKFATWKQTISSPTINVCSMLEKSLFGLGDILRVETEMVFLPYASGSHAYS